MNQPGLSLFTSNYFSIYTVNINFKIQDMQGVFKIVICYINNSIKLLNIYSKENVNCSISLIAHTNFVITCNIESWLFHKDFATSAAE